MKRELGYVYREPEIILQRAACGSRAPRLNQLGYVENTQKKVIEARTDGGKRSDRHRKRRD